MKLEVTTVSLAVIAGAVAFLFADALEAKYWDWFACGASFSPWFLNTGRAVLFTSASIFTAGASIAMAGVLFMRGPGTLFPLVLAFGACALLLSAAAGTGAAFLFSPHF